MSVGCLTKQLFDTSTGQTAMTRSRRRAKKADNAIKRGGGRQPKRGGQRKREWKLHTRLNQKAQPFT
ncbi:hypothetical protein I656_02008 [Geobacillus sp. WSUCF1]|nr:hypothetical protein I656_02008 [Geobacillus sp. WSUCF1]